MHHLISNLGPSGSWGNPQLPFFLFLVGGGCMCDLTIYSGRRDFVSYVWDCPSERAGVARFVAGLPCIVEEVEYWGGDRFLVRYKDKQHPDLFYYSASSYR